MDHDDVMMPDFSSVLSEGDGSSRNTQTQTGDDEPEASASNFSIKIKDIMEDRQAFEIESEDELLDVSSQDEQEPGSELGRGPRPHIGAESDTDSDSDSDSDSESDFESESSDSESSESESEEDSSESEEISDDESCASSYGSRRASKEIEVGECEEEEDEVVHVYDEQEEDEEEDEDDEEEHEVCYENTDLGGENVDAASLIAASILAGGGAVRSGTGWTWTSIFIIISAAGGIGIVLLYAIKRISELTRLVKTLEENSHMAINERDVQVITTQVIGDMLKDADDSRDQTTETTDQEVQTEFNNFVAEENQEVQQSLSEILQKDGSEKSEHGEDDSVDEPVPDAVSDFEKEDLSEEKHENVKENTSLVPVLDKPLATVEKKQEIIVDAMEPPKKLSIAVDVEQKNPVSEESVGEKPVAVVQKTDKEEPESVVDDLVTMVETMSLSSDPVQTKEPSRLITGAKRVRSA